ncbi:MAG: VOC family protein [Ilumatobacteraceae bacterium]
MMSATCTFVYISAVRKEKRRAGQPDGHTDSGGAQFPQSEAVSFEMQCDTQDELDRIWNALTVDGGQEGMCGWCRDRFGVSWQVVPRQLIELLDRDDGVADRVWAAMMTMQRIDLATLEAAARGEDGPRP